MLWKPRQVIREYKAQGWNIGNIEIAKDAQRAGRCLNRLVTGLWVLDISNGVADTIQAYREHKDWVGEAEKSMAEIVTPKAISTLDKIALRTIKFTPRGWVGVIVVAAVEAGLSIYIDHKINEMRAE